VITCEFAIAALCSLESLAKDDASTQQGAAVITSSAEVCSVVPPVELLHFRVTRVGAGGEVVVVSEYLKVIVATALVNGATGTVHYPERGLLRSTMGAWGMLTPGRPGAKKLQHDCDYRVQRAALWSALSILKVRAALRCVPHIAPTPALTPTSSQQDAGRAEAYECILQLWWDQMDAGMQRVYLSCTFYVPIPAAVRIAHVATVTAAAAAAATVTAAAATTTAAAAAAAVPLAAAVNTVAANPPPPAVSEKHGHGLRFPGSVARSV
jgi:hypothetical protein